MTNAIQITTTTAEKSDADKIVKALVEWRLAACVHVSGPIESTYWWDGAIETATEWRCTIKTRSDVYPIAERAIRELHPYDEPAIIATAIVAGSDSYLEWLAREVNPASD